MGHIIGGHLEKVSEFTVRRLSSYFRILEDLEKKDVVTVSSAKLGELGGVTSAQVRKDLSYFGNFGTRGLGYNVVDLKETIMKILGLQQRWKMALFGAGSLGRALFFYKGFREDGFLFTHIFDTDQKKAGVKWKAVEIRPTSEAETRLTTDPVDIGVIATPGEAAQKTVNLMVKAGVKGVLNFAPARLDIPNEMWLRNVNLAVALESLSFYMSL
jgi:redox-sensing transcriptional repressor